MSDLSGSNWTEIDAGNTTTPPLGWPEGQMPSTVNDCARMMMGALKRMWNRINGVVTTTGGGYTYATANTTYPSAYVTGETYRFKAHRTSTGNDQMQVNTLAPKNLYKRSSGGAIAIGAGDIVAGDMVSVTYDGSLNASAGGFWCGDNIGSLQKTDATVTYVNKSGDTINNFLNVTGPISATGQVNSTGGSAGYSFTSRDNSGQQWLWYADASTAHLWMNGGIKMNVDLNGNGSVPGSWSVGGTVTAGYITSTGNVNANSSVTASGNVTANGTVQGAYVYSTGNVAAAGSVSAGGIAWYNSGGWMNCDSPVQTTNTFRSLGNRIISQGGNAPSVSCYNTSDGNCMGFWASSGRMTIGNLDGAGNPTANRLWVTTAGHFAPDTNGGQYCGLAAQPWAGVESYNFYNASDARVKTGIRDLPDCLDLVRRIKPKRYRLKDVLDDTNEHWGFIAQDVGKIMGPDFAGYRPAQTEEEIDALSYNELIAILWKALQELSARLDK